MDFKIDNGPWETVLNGKFQGHDVEIVSNPEHLFLVLIYDKDEKGVVNGALVEGYKAFTTRGNIDAFIETLPRPSLGVTKNIGEKTVRLFFASLDMIYLDFRHEDFVRKIDKMIANVSENANTMFDLARASSIELKEPNVSPSSEYEPILGDPFTMRLLMGGATKKLDAAKGVKKTFGEEKSERKFQMGLTKTREIISENPENFSRALIMANNSNEQKYAAYIIAENFLLNNSPLLIFDSENYFEKLKNASKNDIDLKEGLVEFDPIGFPVKKILAKDEIKISLKDVDFVLLLNLIGTGDDEFEKKFALTASSAMADTTEELIEKLASMPANDSKNFESLKFEENKAYFSTGLTDFEKIKAERIVNIIEQEFSGLFGKSVDPKELTTSWPGNLGKATILDTKKLSEKEKIMFEQTILRMLLKSTKEKSETEYKIILPNAEKLFKTLPSKSSSAIISLENKGVGFIFGISTKTFPNDLLETTTAKISIINKNDAAISIKNQRNYRVMLRPPLSGDIKI
ncbi:MAG: hypothetical protein WC308_02085 [archaeon]